MKSKGSLSIVLLQVSSFIAQLLCVACLDSGSSAGIDVETRSFESASCDVDCKITKILNSTIPCQELENCNTVNVTLSPKSRVKGSAERILVIDQKIRLAAYTRYKSRVLDHLIANEEGEYVSNPQTLKVPNAVFEILSKILDEQHPSTPAFQLNDISDKFVDHLRCMDSNSAHGTQIFGTLADLNPEAEFVIADPFYPFGGRFCDAHRNHQILEEYKKHLRAASTSLAENIDKYDIDYVNMSFGHSRKGIERSWSHACQASLPSKSFFLDLQKIFFTEFYEPLFANKNVVFVEAGPYETRTLFAGSDPDFYIDSQNIDNRLVVSGFSEMDPRLPILGSNNANPLTDHSSPWESTDIYVNFGVSQKRRYEKGPFPVLISSEGVGADALFDVPSTSLATPVGLSYLNYLKKSGLITGSGKELVSNFKNYHQGKLVEPARYKQFEVYRLGRLP